MPRVAAGHDIGVPFSLVTILLGMQEKVTRYDVQEAQMSRVHGCTGATKAKSNVKKNLRLKRLLLLPGKIQQHNPRKTQQPGNNRHRG
jgi:hypothetical protein